MQRERAYCTVGPDKIDKRAQWAFRKRRTGNKNGELVHSTVAERDNIPFLHNVLFFPSSRTAPFLSLDGSYASGGKQVRRSAHFPG